MTEPAKLLLPLLLALRPAAAPAQVPPAGQGLLGEYYEGANFERLVARRTDATIAFDWHHAPPAAGLPTEYFSVRWTGWLLAPASGRYTFRATVDDGMRIWLDNQLILDEWRPQPVRTFSTTVDLKAGQAYQLRVDYFQEILDTRARLVWERPDVARRPPPPASWRNLWGLTGSAPPPAQPIPMRYLFIRNPRPGTAAVAAPRPRLLAAAHPPLSMLPKPSSAQPRQAAARPASPPAAARLALPGRRTAPTVTVLKLVAVSPATPLRPVAPPVAPPISPTDTARLARLAVGEALTLPALFFEQGQARLLPATRDALDKVATVLGARPGLRFEVQGHTDNVGSAELNRQLSQQRAEAVCLYLRAHGVGTAQLRPLGYGGTQPVADNTDPAQRPRNRRVVLRRL